MAIHYPPQYRYSLFEQWDRDVFEQITQIGKKKQFPKIIGSNEEINDYLITLIRTQKALNDWRDLLVDTLSQVKQTNTIDAKLLCQKYPPESIGKDEPAWVTYEEDRIVSQFIDSLEIRYVDFVGTDKEKGEFVIRFILGQLSHDWEQTIVLIWEMLGDESKLSVNELNKELKNFDYMKLLDLYDN